MLLININVYIYHYSIRIFCYYALILDDFHVIKESINFAYNRQVNYLLKSKKLLSLKFLEDKSTKYFSLALEFFISMP